MLFFDQPLRRSLTTTVQSDTERLFYTHKKHNTMHKISEVQLSAPNSFPELEKQFQAYLDDKGIHHSARVKQAGNIITLELIEVGPDIDKDNVIRKFKEIFDQGN